MTSRIVLDPGLSAADINAALNAYDVVVLQGDYETTETIVVRDNKTLIGRNATIFAPYDSFHVVFAYGGLNGFSNNSIIKDIKVIGGKYGIIHRGRNGAVEGCEASETSLHGIALHGNGMYNMRVERNVTNDTGQSGIGISGTIDGAVIFNNIANNAALDGFTGYDIGNRRVHWINNTSNGAGNHGTHVGGDHISVVGGVYLDSEHSGVLADGHTTGRNSNIRIVNCTVEESKGRSIFVKEYDYGFVHNNIIHHSGIHGIDIVNSNHLTVSKNFVELSNNNGIRSDSLSKYNKIVSNILRSDDVAVHHSTTEELNNYYV